MKEKLQPTLQKYRDHKNTLQTVIGQCLYNLEKIDKFQETYTPPRLSQEETENLNRMITSNKIESLIKKKISQKTKVQDKMASQVNYSKHLKNNTYLCQTIPKNC